MDEDSATAEVIRILLVGDKGTGKTCFASYFADSNFNANSSPTIAIDVKSKVIDVSQTKGTR